MKKTIGAILLLTAIIWVAACNKNNNAPAGTGMHYYQIAFDTDASDWRDTSFVVATNNPALIQKTNEQLSKPIGERQMVNGKLVSGNAGYNVNASHSFLWHFDENDWDYADISAEVYDGRPYSDVDQDTGYWIGTLGRFAPWSSYVAREIEKP